LRRDPATIVAVEKQELLHIPKDLFVALGTQHAMRMRRIVPGYILFFHIIS
jgi:hypothetical protein